MENINHDLKELYNIDDFTRNYDNDIRDVELILLSEYPDSACECTGKSIKQAVLENKEKETYRQGITIGGGIAGGAAGGATAGLICGPGSRICSTVGVIIGGAIGGVSAYLLVDAFDEELEAFTQWTLF